MIAISNQQRDDIIRYIDMLCTAYAERNDIRTYNALRRARILRRQLAGKAEFPASDLRDNIKFHRPQK